MKKKILAGILCVAVCAAMMTGCQPTQVKVEPVESLAIAGVEAPQAEAGDAQEVVADQVPEAAPAETVPEVAAEPVTEAAPEAVQDAAAEPAPAEAVPAEPAAAEPAAAEPVAAEPAAAPAAAEPAAAPAAAEPAAAPAAAAPAEAAEAAPEETIETAAPTEPGEDQMYSYLTGEIIDKSVGQQRPFAVMINNLDPAVPQSGLIYADIIYEAFVESDITRLMAVFQDPGNLDKIGPVRSCRHYYLYLSDDVEGVYTHFGWSIFGEAMINEQARTTINGMFYDGGIGFYRTSDRVAPHNAYVTADGLRELADSLGVDRSYPEGYQAPLHFYTTDTEPAGEDATVIQLGYPVDNPWFEYNPEDKLYYRFEYGAPHVDMETGEQLKFKNVLVQYVNQWTIADTYLLELDLFNTGGGLYFSDGKVIPITWHKEGLNDRTHYYTTDGQLLNMNPGKTMIQIIPQDYGCTYSTSMDAIDTSAPQVEVADTDWG